MISYYDPKSYHSVKKIDEEHAYCTLCLKIVKCDNLSTLEGRIYRHIATLKHQEIYDNLVAYING